METLIASLRAAFSRVNPLARINARISELEESLWFAESGLRVALGAMEKKMAQMDDLKASQARLTDALTKFTAAFGALKVENDSLKAQMAAMAPPTDPADMQAVIDHTNALADSIEAQTPAM